MNEIQAESFLKKQRAIYEILNEDGNGTDLGECTILFTKILAQLLSHEGDDIKLVHKYLVDLNSVFEMNFEFICKIQKDLPDDLGCRTHQFNSPEEAKEFLKNNKDRIEEAKKSNIEFAKDFDKRKK